MLAFEWNALRAGEPVLVHDDRTTGLDLAEGVVTIVQTQWPRTNDIGVRLGSTGEVVHPRRHAVHLLPLEPPGDCWRCATAAGVPARHGRSAAPAGSPA